MNPYNPYEAPQTNESQFGAVPADNAQAAILEAMKRTRPWVLFLSILGFLAAAAMFLFGFVMLVAGASMAAFAKGPMEKLTPLLSLLYFALGAFYVVPSVLLFRYGSSIGSFSTSGGSMDTLATAVQRQASFWRFSGIFTAVLIALYFVGIMVAVVVGIIAGASR